MKKLIIFDFDGTLVDTSEGLIDTHAHTLREIGLTAPDNEKMKAILSAGLYNTYHTVIGLPEEEARRAMSIYRVKYRESGAAMSRVYDGIPALLDNLKKRGFLLGVATMKKQENTDSMLKLHGIYHMFDAVFGMDDTDSLTKADIIKKCCSHLETGTDEALMIGDSNVDLEGSGAAGVDFIGVTYGFGFEPGKDYPFTTAESVEQLRSLLCI